MSGAVHEATARQRAAANPTGSAWVSANAGSGKTRVLTERVARLLLSGADPSRILCLTYTKAAAAEMSQRLLGTLGKWSTLGDAALLDSLIAVTGEEIARGRLPEARRLFALALEAPGGLKIETIHAFCQRVLKRFPVEAGLAPDFAVLDEAEALALSDEAKRRVLRRMGESEKDLEAAFDRLLAVKGEFGFHELVKWGLGERKSIEAYVAHTGDVEAIVASVRLHLGIGQGDTLETVRALRSAGSDWDREGLRRAAAAMAQGSPRDRTRSDAITAFTSDPSERNWGAYRSAFLTKDGEPIKEIATKGAQKANPWIDAVLRQEQERLLRLAARERAVNVAEQTAAGLTLMQAILAEYREMKARKHVLDYEDLIRATRALLADTSAAWVHFKLDGGIDHLLVDEAQDTSPDQWEIVKALTAEFFALERDQDQRLRTVFAVGDEKQSIYSFQGADPREFAAMRAHFEKHASGAGHEWTKSTLEISFRSAPAILETVDAVFAGPEARRALTSGEEEVRHRSAREGVRGLVELWPYAARSGFESEVHRDWMAPVDSLPPDNPETKLADRIAKLIRRWLDDAEPLAPGGKAIDCGDVLILVRRRASMFYEMLRALNREKLAVAGADRMLLRDEAAFLDLDALGRFCVFPSDDLALAEVLKGPFCGLTDEDLLKLAPGRQRSLWRAFRESADYKAQLAWLKARLDDAREMRPFEFYTRALGGSSAETGRHSMFRRLGLDADDAIEEFLSLALAYEREEIPTLQGFLRYATAQADEIKRDMEEAGGRVRVMTVHGAKGLEAPIVFLIDTCSEPRSSRNAWLLDQSSEPVFPLLRVAAEERDDVSLQAANAERARQNDEYLRQLYVAMTRAKDRLYVAGVATKNDLTKGELKQGSWHARIDTALQTLGAQKIGTGEESLLRYGDVPAGTGASVSETQVRVPLPPWISRLPPAERAPLRRTPSGLLAKEASRLPATPPAGAGHAILRGRLIHKLLEELPKLASSERERAARRLLTLVRYAPLAEAHEEILAETFHILEDGKFAHVFSPASRAEVAIAGSFHGEDGRRILVSGQIDRLVVLPERVLVVDYKTNREVPDPVPPAYIAQMAAYRRLLTEIFPGKPIEAALLFTSVPRLIPLPANLLDVAQITGEGEAVS